MILQNEDVIEDNESILNIRKLKNNHYDKDLRSTVQKNLSEKRKDREYYDKKFKEAKAKYERAKYSRGYSFQEKKERERDQNYFLDIFVKKDQEVKTISDQLYGISRCKYDLFQGTGFA